ncbi:hypothetical protein 2 [Wenzhou picorna-like virus 41]|uniref:hypothetical protein 2 n=1 Tax=Wenzhou picorna-like virus 41 TaxID=1923628 RepID=UPI00090B14BA|nr:hypothetical protein 2 [Wenzhou picorna-like virus 41]APG78515.1 hypothetical protein 2 [Wenzhou picorna-like virus 41]
MNMQCAHTINSANTSESKFEDTTELALRETQELGINPVMTREYIDSKYKFDTSPYTGRFFFVKSFNWTTTAIRYTYLGGILSIPKDLFSTNASLQNLILAAGYYRMKLTLSISIGGTISHGGCLLVAVTPPISPDFGAQPNTINSLMSCPHGFLYANEATSIEIAVPWYCGADYAPVAISDHADFNSTPGSYASLMFLVLNPLKDGGGTQSLTLTVMARFDELELKVPAPNLATWVAPPNQIMRSESMIGSVAKGITMMTQAGKKVANTVGDIFDKTSRISSLFTGLHNPNDTTINSRMIMSKQNFINTVDAQQYFEKLDPYVSAERVTDDHIFGTTEDEMSTRYLTAKEQYLATIIVSTSDTVGTLLFSRPMSPYQTYEVSFANNISLMYYLTRGWNGDFEIVFRSAGTAKQQLKLYLNRFYSPVEGFYGNVPTMSSSVNGLSQLLEFSMGGQEHVCYFPYISPLEITPNTMDQSTAPVLTGVYYVYLAQPLVVGDAAPTDIEINVFIRSRTLNFYGYSINTPYIPPIQDRAAREQEEPMRSEGSGCPPNFSVLGSVNPQDGNRVDESTGTVSNRIHRVVHGRDIVRRMYRVCTAVRLANRNNIIIPIASLIGADSPTAEMVGVVQTPLTLYSSMYYGRQIGFKFRVRATGSGIFNLRVAYLPPQPIIRNASGNVSVASCQANTNLDLIRFPLPFQNTIEEHVSVTTTSITQLVAEFVVPNVSMMKFNTSPVTNKIGGPSQALYSQSYGYLVIEGNLGNAPNIEILVGLTDESRLGHHTMAPLIVQDGPPLTGTVVHSPYLSAAGSDIAWSGNAPSHYTKGVKPVY